MYKVKYQKSNLYFNIFDFFLLFIQVLTVFGLYDFFKICTFFDSLILSNSIFYMIISSILVSFFSFVFIKSYKTIENLSIFIFLGIFILFILFYAAKNTDHYMYILITVFFLIKLFSGLFFIDYIKYPEHTYYSVFSNLLFNILGVVSGFLAGYFMFFYVTDIRIIFLIYRFLGLSALGLLFYFLIFFKKKNIKVHFKEKLMLMLNKKIIVYLTFIFLIQLVMYMKISDLFTR